MHVHVVNRFCQPSKLELVWKLPRYGGCERDDFISTTWAFLPRVGKKDGQTMYGLGGSRRSLWSSSRQTRIQDWIVRMLDLFERLRFHQRPFFDVVWSCVPSRVCEQVPSNVNHTVLAVSFVPAGTTPTIREKDGCSATSPTSDVRRASDSFVVCARHPVGRCHRRTRDFERTPNLVVSCER